MAGRPNYEMPWMEELGIPDAEMDALINGAIDRVYTDEPAQRGDAQLFRLGGYPPPQRPVGHSRSYVRGMLDDGGQPNLRARMEEQWREPDDTTLDAILSLMEGGGEPSANDEMLLDMMKVDGFGDGQEDLQERFDHLRPQRFPELDTDENPVWGGDLDEAPGWFPPGEAEMAQLVEYLMNAQRPQMGARGDTGMPGSAQQLLQMLGRRSDSGGGAQIDTETPSPAWDNLYGGMGRRGR